MDRSRSEGHVVGHWTIGFDEFAHIETKWGRMCLSAQHYHSFYPGVIVSAQDRSHAYSPVRMMCSQPKGET